MCFTYLDVKFDRDLVDNFEENIGKENAESRVAQECDKVPDAAVTFASQLLQVDSENQV